MKSDKNMQEPETSTVLRAKFRLGLLMVLLFLNYIIDAYITFPFVEHTTSAQNVAYGLVVTAPFYVTVIIFIMVTWKDLTAIKKK